MFPFFFASSQLLSGKFLYQVRHYALCDKYCVAAQRPDPKAPAAAQSPNLWHQQVLRHWDRVVWKKQNKQLLSSCIHHVPWRQVGVAIVTPSVRLDMKWWSGPDSVCVRVCVCVVGRMPHTKTNLCEYLKMCFGRCWPGLAQASQLFRSIFFSSSGHMMCTWVTWCVFSRDARY